MVNGFIEKIKKKRYRVNFTYYVNVICPNSTYLTFFGYTYTYLTYKQTNYLYLLKKLHLNAPTTFKKKRKFVKKIKIRKYNLREFNIFFKTK